MVPAPPTESVIEPTFMGPTCTSGHDQIRRDAALPTFAS